MRPVFDLPHFEHLWIPASAGAAARDERLLVVLHDRGSNAGALQQLPAHLPLANLNFLLLQAPYPYGDGYTWFSNADGAHELLMIRERLSDLFETLLRAGWDTRDVFIFGHGQGATVAHDFALTYPRSLAGVVASSGDVHFFSDWRRTLSATAFHSPRLVTHGFFDEVVPVERVRDAIDELRSVGLPVMSRELNKGHELDDENELPLIEKWLLSKMPFDGRRAPPRPEIHVPDQMSSSHS